MIEWVLLISINLLQSGQTGAGAVGVGGLPTDTSILSLGLSLVLVPLELTAVAVFPPFAT